MSKLSIIVDSTANIPPSFLEQYGIRVIPLYLIWGDRMFKDSVDIQPDELYKELEHAKSLPSTSQATPLDFQKIFVEELEQGNDVLALLISSKLSGTVQSALQAKEVLGSPKIKIVDTSSTSMGLGYIALTVARAAENGATLSECHDLAKRAIAHTGIFFTVDNLKYLHMGGRIGGAARFMGTALDLKPILELRDGRIEALERVRTKTKALQRMLDLVEERIAGRKSVRIASIHARAKAEAETLLESAVQRFHPEETVLADVSPIIGAHTGPGTLGIVYMAGL